jgi:hypothetical protein
MRRLISGVASPLVIAASAPTPGRAVGATRGHVCYPYICEVNTDCPLPECACRYIGLDGECGGPG